MQDVRNQGTLQNKKAIRAWCREKYGRNWWNSESKAKYFDEAKRALGSSTTENSSITSTVSNNSEVVKQPVASEELKSHPSSFTVIMTSLNVLMLICNLFFIVGAVESSETENQFLKIDYPLSRGCDTQYSVLYAPRHLSQTN